MYQLSLVCRWRGKMQHILHSNYFHIIIVILVVLDAFIVLFELLLDVGAFSKHGQYIVYTVRLSLKVLYLVHVA